MRTIHPKELERRIKRLNPEMEFKRYSNRNEEYLHGGCDAIYCRGELVCSIPPGRMYKQRIEGYEDNRGARHRSLYGLADKLAAVGVIHPRDKYKLING